MRYQASGATARELRKEQSVPSKSSSPLKRSKLVNKSVVALRGSARWRYVQNTVGGTGELGTRELTIFCSDPGRLPQFSLHLSLLLRPLIKLLVPKYGEVL